MSCGGSCGGGAGECTCDGGEQPLSPAQYWATQQRLSQYQGCPGCVGSVPSYLAPVRKGSLGAVPFGELTWTQCTNVEARGAIPSLIVWTYSVRTPSVLAMWYSASFGVGWYYRAIVIPGQPTTFWKSQACPNYGTVGPQPVSIPRRTTGPFTSSLLGQATSPGVAVTTNTAPAATTSTTTVITVGLLSLAAGAGLAYAITKHHDARKR